MATSPSTPDRDATSGPALLAPTDSKQTPRFAGFATFLRAALAAPTDELDVALFGIPVDTGSNRIGTRLGPAQIREMSRFIRRYTSDGVSPFELCRVADVGDAPVNPLDFTKTLQLAQEFVAGLCSRGAAPVAAGGDHAITYPMVAAIAGNGKPVGLLQFDSHPDLSDENFGNRLNNGTQIRRLVEEGMVDPHRSIAVGIRGTRFNLNDRDFYAQSGFHLLTMDEFDERGRADSIELIQQTLGDGPSYITFDIDGLDPPYCPGTGAPEPGGLSMRDALVILRSLRGREIVGADVCEIQPALDPQGETALNAANLMMELATLAATTAAA